MLRILAIGLVLAAVAAPAYGDEDSARRAESAAARAEEAAKRSEDAAARTEAAVDRLERAFAELEQREKAAARERTRARRP